jgi:hypothetical protein
MTPAARAANRQRRREQQRRHRQREREGKRVYPIELDGLILDFLVHTEWLAEAVASDDGAVAAAVTALLTDAARKS